MTEYKAKCKHKKSIQINSGLHGPFPQKSISKDDRIPGLFTGIAVEVIEQCNIKKIYDYGCYGKGNKSRGRPKKQGEILVLSLEEAAFLCYVLDVVKIIDTEMADITWDVYLSIARRVNSNFVQHLAGYIYLKSQNWVIKSGVKFGAHYQIYKSSPQYYHASFLVIIVSNSQSSLFVQKDIKGLQRISETSGKDVLLLDIVQPKDFVFKVLTDYQIFTVTETILKRFNYSSFIQTHQQENNKLL